MQLANLRSEAERVAAGRSRLYQLVNVAFQFPDQEFYEDVHNGSFARVLGEACQTLPYDLGVIAGEDLRGVGDSYIEFESEYIRLFDVGAAGPPCPLYGGVYGGDRMKVMEEATRFYNFFHLHLSPTMRELPDHITTELEFLHYLTFREAEARQNGVDVESLLRAQRDFLTRHLCRWVPKLQARLAKQTTLPFFGALVSFAATFFQADRAYAAAACGS